MATTLLDIGRVTQRLPSWSKPQAVGEAEFAALLGVERAHGGEVRHALAQQRAVLLGFAERAVGVDREAQHVAAGRRADVGVLLLGVERDSVGEEDFGREHRRRAVGLDSEEEAVGSAGEGVRAAPRCRVGDPDAALRVDVGIVRGDQGDAVDGVGEYFDLARLGVEALDGPRAAVAIEPADVGDDDPALAVHVDAVGRTAGVADAG